MSVSCQSAPSVPSNPPSPSSPSHRRRTWRIATTAAATTAASRMKLITTPVEPLACDTSGILAAKAFKAKANSCTDQSPAKISFVRPDSRIKQRNSQRNTVSRQPEGTRSFAKKQATGPHGVQYGDAARHRSSRDSRGRPFCPPHLTFLRLPAALVHPGNLG